MTTCNKKLAEENLPYPPTCDKCVGGLCVEPTEKIVVPARITLVVMDCQDREKHILVYADEDKANRVAESLRKVNLEATVYVTSYDVIQ